MIETPNGASSGAAGSVTVNAGNGVGIGGTGGSVTLTAGQDALFATGGQLALNSGVFPNGGAGYFNRWC